MALAGDTLYGGAYQVNNSTVSDNALIAIDLTTGVATAPVAQAAQVQLWSALGNVYMSEYRDDGTIWLLHPGAAPVALVEHLATPTVVTADSDYVYWASAANIVQRRLLAGGPIQTVMACNEPSRLVIDDTDIYCAEGFQGHVLRALKDGTSLADTITTMGNDYPIVSMIKDGAALYYANLDPMPDLMQINPVTSDYFYLSNPFAGGLQRIQRATHAVETIVTDIGIYYDPVLWNKHVYYETQNPQASGERYVMQCVD